MACVEFTRYTWSRAAGKVEILAVGFPAQIVSNFFLNKQDTILNGRSIKLKTACNNSLILASRAELTAED
jgi:hypothetical protein